MKIYVILSQYKAGAFEYCAVFDTKEKAYKHIRKREGELGGDCYSFEIIEDRVR